MKKKGIIIFSIVSLILLGVGYTISHNFETKTYLVEKPLEEIIYWVSSDLYYDGDECVVHEEIIRDGFVLNDHPFYKTKEEAEAVVKDCRRNNIEQEIESMQPRLEWCRAQDISTMPFKEYRDCNYAERREGLLKQALIDIS